MSAPAMRLTTRMLVLMALSLRGESVAVKDRSG
jgi:hypothetical protein